MMNFTLVSINFLYVPQGTRRVVEERRRRKGEGREGDRIEKVPRNDINFIPQQLSLLHHNILTYIYM